MQIVLFPTIYLFLRRWQSGQLHQTVNLTEYSYGGSNPSRRTKYQTQSDYSGFVVFRSAGRDLKDGSGIQDERNECLSLSQGS